MRKTLLSSITFSLLLFSLPLSVIGQADRLEIHFFGSRTCGECLEIKETILKPLAVEFPDSISLNLHEIEDPKSFQLMVAMEELHGINDPSPQELFLPGRYLAGADEIMASGEPLIREYLANPDRWKENILPDIDSPDEDEYEDDLKDRFDHFTFISVLIAGLVDGVNPCAIATMIFLVSFLAHQKRRPSQVIIIGMTFTATVYITYLLLGLGAFKVITGLTGYRWLAILIRWSAVAAAGIVGIISFRDALAYKRSGETGDIVLQMPRSVKIRVHKLISGHLRGRHIVTGAIVTGFLVTLFEAVCTGQVYLPTIILMTRSTGLQLTGWLYLLFYNFLFVLPLLIVMIYAYFGLTWHTMAKTTQKHLFLLKILLGCVMVGLALFLAIA
jgi:cytochrome c biogenesis protein CcdA